MEEEKPELVITDLMMSRTDSGFSFSQRIKEDPRFQAVPVIIVSAIRSTRGFDFRATGPPDLHAMGADAYFEKPIPTVALAAKIEDLLAKPARRTLCEE